MSPLIELIPLLALGFGAGAYVQQMRSDIADLKRRMIVVENKFHTK